MAEESRMNLAALQQRDPYITEIIDKAVKVTLYKFSQQMSKWSVTDIEGSLFVYRRSASPSYGLMILNRKDLNNLVQPLTNQVEFHLNTPFLLFKKLSDDLEDAILGIWFVDTGECIRLTEKIQRILREVSGRGEEKCSNMDGVSARCLEGKSVEAGQNILSLLTNAQKTYDQEHGATYEQTDPRPIKHPSGDASGMSQISLADLFRTVNLHSAKAGMVDTATDTPKHPVFGRSLSVAEVEAQPVDNRHPILKLISSKTVEEIEKQHIEEEHKRLKGGGGSAGNSGHSPGGHQTEGGIDLMQLLRQGAAKQSIKSLGVEGDSGDKGSSLTSDGAAAVKKLINMQDPKFGTNRGFIPVAAASQCESYPAMPDAPLAEDIHGDKKKDNSALFPIMLKPSDLDPSLGKSKSPPAFTALLTPQAFLDRPFQDAMTPPPSSGLAPLTRDQLQQAMLHLIKNDSNFVSTLHAAYLESFHAATGNKL
ncbi:mRNA-decapping enzyme 1A-like [Physella acuta]|uniref:mRNA-decapping enzyme 1A-like n=1 Tax=Physella acuta TaxID=109671 RepID=UPI0027DBAC2C|nr:mRNA-decapping enzyme 1A-like [Physella acuta]